MANATFTVRGVTPRTVLEEEQLLWLLGEGWTELQSTFPQYQARHLDRAITRFLKISNRISDLKIDGEDVDFRLLEVTDTLPDIIEKFNEYLDTSFYEILEGLEVEITTFDKPKNPITQPDGKALDPNSEGSG